jgi:PAS domain S-box-containing protein
MKLVNKILMTFLFIALVPLAIISYFSYQQGRNIILNEITNTLVVITELKHSELESWVEGNLHFLTSIAQNPLVIIYSGIIIDESANQIAREFVYNHLLEYHFNPNLRTNDALDALSLLNPESGEILVSTSPMLEGLINDDKAFLQDASNQAVMQYPSHSAEFDQITMHIGVPVQDADGNTIAILAAHLNLDQLTDILLQRTQVLPSEETYLVDQNRLFITESRFSTDSMINKTVDTQAVKDCLSGLSGDGIYHDYRDIEVIGVFHWIPEFELCMISEVNYEEVLAPIKALGAQILSISVLILSVVVLVAILFSRTMTRPLRKLVQATENIAQGELETEIEIKTKDEIGALASSFNRMSTHLQQAHQETQRGQSVLLSLSEGAQRIQLAKTPQEIYRRVGQESERLNFQSMIFVYDPEFKTIKVDHVHFNPGVLKRLEQTLGLKLDQLQLPLDQDDIFEKVNYENQARIVDSVHPYLKGLLPKDFHDELDQIFQSLELQQAMLAPLMVNQKPYGYLLFLGAEIHQNDLPAVTIFANQLCVALENSLLMQSLSESEEYFRSLIGNVNDIIAILDLQGTLRYISPSITTVLGYQQDEKLGEIVFDMVHPDDLQVVVDSFFHIVQYPLESSEVQFRFQRKDGSWCFLDGIGKVAQSSQKQPIVIVTLRDQTEKRAVQMEMEAQRVFLENIYRGVELAIFIVDVDPTGEIRFAGVNPRHERLSGLKSDVLQGKTPEDLVPEYLTSQSAAEIRKNYESAIESGQSIEYEEELTISGEKHWWLTRINPLKDAQGQVYRLVGSSLQITERKRIEEKLQQAYAQMEKRVSERTAELYASETRYRILADASPDMIYVLDQEYRITYANRNAANVFNLTPEEMMSQQIKELFNPQVGEQQFSMIQQIFLTGERVAFEEQLQFPVGERWLSMILVPMFDEMLGVIAVMVVARDISNRIAYERQLARSNAELEQFAYVASHDLQEPLRMVSSYLQLIERRYADKLDANGHEFIDYAVDGAHRMKQLIEDLLAYSRVSSRAKPMKEVDIQEVIENVQINMQIKFEENQAMLSYDEMPTVWGDSIQLGQVFQNLVDNAIKFKGEEALQIHIGAEKIDSAWQFSVADNGQGFDMQYRSRIFEIFERLHTREETSGTGIGLAICKRIVERHGGKIWAESQPGEGSTFYFTIPDSIMDNPLLEQIVID